MTLVTVIMVVMISSHLYAMNQTVTIDAGRSINHQRTASHSTVECS